MEFMGEQSLWGGSDMQEKEIKLWAELMRKGTLLPPLLSHSWIIFSFSKIPTFTLSSDQLLSGLHLCLGVYVPGMSARSQGTHGRQTWLSRASWQRMLLSKF